MGLSQTLVMDVLGKLQRQEGKWNDMGRVTKLFIPCRELAKSV